MTVTLNPYLNFRGTTREAMEFYHSVFGGELTVSTFEELGGDVPTEEKSLIMHSQLTVPNGLTLMAADVPQHMDWATGTNAYSVSLSGDDDATLRGYWDKLSAGGTIHEPLVVAPWGDAFGMFTDKYGVHWLVNISAAAA